VSSADRLSKVCGSCSAPLKGRIPGFNRVRERRFYPYGVYSEKKRLEKLNYMHNNPVKRGLMRLPEERAWPS
jgi:putative transposase